MVVGSNDVTAEKKDAPGTFPARETQPMPGLARQSGTTDHT